MNTMNLPLNSFAFSLFVPKSGPTLWILISICVALCIGVLVLLTVLPSKARKPLVVALTFIMGTYYFTEFMFPGRQLAPIRSSLSAAVPRIRGAKQDLYAIALGKKDKAARLAHATKMLQEAEGYLDRASRQIEEAKKRAAQQSDDAAKEAEEWAKRYNVSDDLLTRDTDSNKIMDLRTQALQKRIDDLNAAGTAVSGITANGENKQGAKQVVQRATSRLKGASTEDFAEMSTELGDISDRLSLSISNLTDNNLTPYNQPVGDTVIVVGALTFGLGLISLGSIHGKVVMKRRQGWYNSLAFFIAAISIALAGFFKDYMQNQQVQSISSTAYFILFNGILKALAATMFSLVAFYIVSAAYRAFRVKSTEAGLMMAAAFLIMLAIVPFGVMITDGLHGGWSALRLENVGNWILKYPNAAAQRGIMFGIGVGGLAMAIRLWLSLERGSYFDKQM